MFINFHLVKGMMTLILLILHLYSCSVREEEAGLNLSEASYEDEAFDDEEYDEFEEEEFKESVAPRDLISALDEQNEVVEEPEEVVDEPKKDPPPKKYKGVFSGIAGVPAGPGLPEFGAKLAYVAVRGDTLESISFKIF